MAEGLVSLPRMTIHTDVVGMASDEAGTRRVKVGTMACMDPDGNGLMNLF